MQVQLITVFLTAVAAVQQGAVKSQNLEVFETHLPYTATVFVESPIQMPHLLRVPKLDGEKIVQQNLKAQAALDWYYGRMEGNVVGKAE